jgi:hypothetical protein
MKLAEEFEAGSNGLQKDWGSAAIWYRETIRLAEGVPHESMGARLAEAAHQRLAELLQTGGHGLDSNLGEAQRQVPINSASAQDAVAQAGVDPDLLAQLQGIWVSRFPRREHAVEVRGVNVLVHVESTSEVPAPRGTVVAVITGLREKTPIVSEVDGRTLHAYEFDMRKWSNHGGGSSGGFRMSDNSYRYNHLSVYTSQCRDRGGNLKPHFNYFSLGGFWGGDMVRQADKDRWFPPNDARPNWADPIVPECP